MKAARRCAQKLVKFTSDHMIWGVAPLGVATFLSRQIPCLLATGMSPPRSKIRIPMLPGDLLSGKHDAAIQLRAAEDMTAWPDDAVS